MPTAAIEQERLLHRRQRSLDLKAFLLAALWVIFAIDTSKIANAPLLENIERVSLLPILVSMAAWAAFTPDSKYYGHRNAALVCYKLIMAVTPMFRKPQFMMTRLQFLPSEGGWFGNISDTLRILVGK